MKTEENTFLRAINAMLEQIQRVNQQINLQHQNCYKIAVSP